jgi:hypothetical protein
MSPCSPTSKPHLMPSEGIRVGDVVLHKQQGRTAEVVIRSDVDDVESHPKSSLQLIST